MVDEYVIALNFMQYNIFFDFLGQAFVFMASSLNNVQMPATKKLYIKINAVTYFSLIKKGSQSIMLWLLKYYTRGSRYQGYGIIINGYC
jgi:hypothetical protein